MIKNDFQKKIVKSEQKQDILADHFLPINLSTYQILIHPFKNIANFLYEHFQDFLGKNAEA